MAALPAASTWRPMRRTSTMPISSSTLSVSPSAARGAASFLAESDRASALSTLLFNSSSIVLAFFSVSSHLRFCSRTCSTYCLAYSSTRSASALRICCCAPVSGSSFLRTWSSSPFSWSKLSGLALESFCSTLRTANVACCCLRTLASSSRRLTSSSCRFFSSSAFARIASSCFRNSSRRLRSASSRRCSSSFLRSSSCSWRLWSSSLAFSASSRLRRSSRLRCSSSSCFRRSSSLRRFSDSTSRSRRSMSSLRLLDISS
mmetsp:Transcript_98429/g.278765  ORF Transcript_98429/g.278765 Transcript_98429/m.278765 type:complete len:260 (-) Transcript_98429:187-966(-)